MTNTGATAPCGRDAGRQDQLTAAALVGLRVRSTIFDIDVSQDGELLVVVDGDPSVLRLGATGWTAVPSPRYVTAIAGLPDGGMIVLKDGLGLATVS